MMQIVDFLYVILILSAIAVTGTLVWVGNEFVKTLKSVREVTDDIKDTTKDLQMVKDTLKVGALSVVSGFIGKLTGGDKYDAK